MQEINLYDHDMYKNYVQNRQNSMSSELESKYIKQQQGKYKESQLSEDDNNHHTTKDSNQDTFETQDPKDRQIDAPTTPRDNHTSDTKGDLLDQIETIEIIEGINNNSSLSLQDKNKALYQFAKD